MSICVSVCLSVCQHRITKDLVLTNVYTSLWHFVWIFFNNTQINVTGDYQDSARFWLYIYATLVDKYV